MVTLQSESPEFRFAQSLADPVRWLALMFPQLGGEDYEEYMQKNLCQPLGMKGTTFYPFGPEWDDRLMPLRFGAGAVADPSKIGEGIQGDGKITWEKLDNQLPLLTLPRR
jgi:hypothetical protein